MKKQLALDPQQVGCGWGTKEPTIRNAVIESTRIENDDHGVLCIWLTLNYGGGGQGFGGYVLYSPDKPEKQKNWAGHFIWRVMEVAGVYRWDQLVGKTVRALADSGKVYEIGHITNNNWFNPSEDFKEMKESE